MSRLSSLLNAALARPFAVGGGLLAMVAALLPWATFILNDGAYPAKATLQFFDAPFALEGFRLQTLLFGVAAIVAALAPVPGRNRVLRGLGWGVLLLSVVNTAFIAGRGGGFGAVTAAGGASAFGGFVGILAGVLLILAAYAAGIEHGVPHWPVALPRPVAYLVLLVSFAGLLWLVSETLTAGGFTAYSGAVFLSFLGFVAGLLGALHGLGVVRWISELSERHRPFSILVLLVAAFVLPFTEAGNEYWMRVAVTIGVYAATAIGLNIVVGLAGLLDLGYVAFLGIGAYVAANLSGAAAAKYDIEVPFILVLVICAIVTGIFGGIVGSPTLRVRGDYLAIVTLAFGEIFRKSAQNDIGDLTGGANAIPGIPPVSMFGHAFNEPVSLFGTGLPSGVLYYFLVVLMIAAIMAIFANLKYSRIGRAWIAIREDEDAARAMGVKTGRAKILAFVVGAMLAGVAGAVFAHSTSNAAYDSFDFIQSVILLAAVVLGGMGTVPGAVLGATLLFVIPEKLREFDEYRLMLFGLALIFIMRFRPQGLIPDRARRAELAGETAEGGSIGEAEELAVRQQEAAEAQHTAPSEPKKEGPA